MIETAAFPSIRDLSDYVRSTNVAHDKKVIQEKKHHGENPEAGAAEKVQPGRKPEMQHHHAHEDPATERAEAAAEEVEKIQETVEAHHEKVDVHKHS